MDKKYFHEQVLIIVSKIPFGRVTSYGAIAETAGMKSSSRYVGYILNTLKGNYDYPCHRVVNRIGCLSGKHNFEGENTMEELLNSEGIEVKNDIVVDFKEKFWKPKV
jgi:methylated-DNA-protein-cysteine methyltransferase-like protein